MEEYRVLGFVFLMIMTKLSWKKEEKKKVTLVMERSEGHGWGKYDMLVE